MLRVYTTARKARSLSKSVHWEASGIDYDSMECKYLNIDIPNHRNFSSFLLFVSFFFFYSSKFQPTRQSILYVLGLRRLFFSATGSLPRAPTNFPDPAQASLRRHDHSCNLANHRLFGLWIETPILSLHYNPTLPPDSPVIMGGSL